MRLYDARPEAAQQAIYGIRKTFTKLAEKGRMSSEAASVAGNRLQAAASAAGLAELVLVVEAIVENVEIKRKLFAEHEGVVGGECVLATNTSSIFDARLKSKDLAKTRTIPNSSSPEQTGCLSKHRRHLRSLHSKIQPHQHRTRPSHLSSAAQTPRVSCMEREILRERTLHAFSIGIADLEEAFSTYCRAIREPSSDGGVDYRKS